MRLLVVSVGRLRAPYADDVAHYEKLLSRYVRLELVELRDAEAVPRRLPRDGFISLLDAGGVSYDSLAFAGFLTARRDSGSDLTFVVGGAKGLDLPRAEHRLSLGPMTLPHQLARVVLLEQIYRAHRIMLGEPYHY